jgi:predicted N-acetyltransferase YhbS
MHIVDLGTAPQHIPRLAAWHHEQWSYLNPDKTIEERIDELREHLAGNPVPRTFIALDDQRLMGSASLIADDMATHPELTPWLASVFVSPLYRKQGVGAALVRRVMTAAAESGIATLSLFTPDQEQLYRRLGWHTVARELYASAEVVIMQIDFRR